MQIHKLYEGKVTLRYDDVKHRYYINNKLAYGVTNVFNYAVSKPGLVYWAASTAAEVVAERLKPGIPLDEIEIDELIQKVKYAHKQKLDKSASMGTRIHAWAESFIKGENPAKPHNEILKDATDRIEKFYQDNNIKPILIERPMCSVEYGLAGTPDLICELNGKLTVLDWKTGSGIYSSNPRQLGAYAKFYHEEFGQWAEQLVVINASVKGHIDKWTSTRPTEEYWQAYKSCLDVAHDERQLAQEIKANTESL